LLEQQLAWVGARLDEVPTASQWRRLLERVERAYDDADTVHARLERDLRNAAAEMAEVYTDLRAITETQIAAERDRLRVVIDALHEGLFLLDAEGRVLVSNLSAATTIGLSFRDLKNRRILELFRPGGGEEQAAEGFLADLVGSGAAYSDEGAELVAADGRVIPVSLLVVPVQGPSGPTGAVVSFLDVTERNEARSALLASEDRFRRLFDRTPVASWELDLSQVVDIAATARLRPGATQDMAAVAHVARRMTITAVNPAALELFDADGETGLIGPFNTALMVEESVPAMLELASAIKARRPRAAVEVVGRSLKGRPLELLVELAASHADGATPYDRLVVTFTDIAHRKEEERRMEELIRLKDEFIATVSHELRTPLAGVVGSAGLLVNNGHELSPVEAAELIGFIHDNGRELSHIIEDLLVGARADIGSLTVNPQPVDIEREVMGVTGALARVLRDRSVFVEPGPAVEAIVDPVRFRQILRNLLTNAARYGGRRVWIRTRPAGDQIRLTVEDDGPGVPDHESETIFAPYQSSATRPGAAGSVGLGLTVSRQLARLHGGDLVYRRENGRSVFELRLPLRVDAGAA
jgi:PAS domain S-box-containing protein